MSDDTERMRARLPRHTRLTMGRAGESTAPVTRKATHNGVGSRRQRDYDEQGRKKPRT